MAFGSWNGTETDDNLDAYTKALVLSKYTMETAKPKQKKKNGKAYNSNKHIPMRYAELGKELTQLSVDIGSLILEANTAWYVGGNLNIADRRDNYIERIKLEKQAIAKTYRMEHIVRVLHEHKPFADSTFNYWIKLICETRKETIAWRDSEIRQLKGCRL